MNAYFLDSSALVKRYVAEAGTPWIQTITAPAMRNPLLIARVTWIEVISALARRERKGTLSSNQVTRTVQTLRYDLDTHYQVVEVDRALTESAGQLVRKHFLRAYDAVQLAAMLKVQPEFMRIGSASLTFVSADDQLIVVARKEGLRVDNPTQHQ